jgi:hypothetical protein
MVGGSAYVPEGVNRYVGASTNAAGTGIWIGGAGTGIGIYPAGANYGHTHGFDNRVQYVDVIIGIKA